MSPVAVVTGAARGIGAATVDRLVGSGWQVVAVDVCADDPALDYALATPGDLTAVGERHGDRVHILTGDVRRRPDMDAAVDAALGTFGRLDAAVAGAGVVFGGPPLWETADAQWNVQFDANVNGVRHLAAAAVPVLLDAPVPRQGRVVAVASAAGMLGLRRLSGYSASKHAVIGLIEGAGRRPGRYRHHRQRGVPRLDPDSDSRRLGGRLRPVVSRGVRPPTAGGAAARTR